MPETTEPSTRIRPRVSPGARQPGIVGRHGAAWKVRVSAAPEDGKANDAVVRLLADVLQLPERRIEIVSGRASRDKVVLLIGIDEDRAASALAKAV